MKNRNLKLFYICPCTRVGQDNVGKPVVKASECWAGPAVVHQHLSIPLNVGCVSPNSPKRRPQRFPHYYHKCIYSVHIAILWIQYLLTHMIHIINIQNEDQRRSSVYQCKSLTCSCFPNRKRFVELWVRDVNHKSRPRADASSRHQLASLQSTVSRYF